MGFWQHSQIFCIFELQKKQKKTEQNKKNSCIEFGKMYGVCVLFTNVHTCLYKSITPSYFGIEPTQLDECFT